MSVAGHESVTRRTLERWRRVFRESPGAAPGGLAVALFLFWAARDGGFDPLRWLPGTLLVLALLVVAFIAGPRRTMPRAVVVSLAGLAGFTAWSYLSIAWAGVPADAWLGANRTFLYLCVFALFVLFPWRAEAAALLLGAFSLGVAAIGLVDVGRLAAADDPAGWFIGGRLASPIAYSNANTALYLIAFFPALHLAARRGVHPILRGVFLASAGVCAELALMSQSRASLGAFPLALAVYFLVVPSRLRSLVALVLVGIVALVAARPVLDIYSSAVAGEGVDVAAADARSAVFSSAAALLIAGTALGLVDRRIRISPTSVRRIGVVVIAALTLGAVAAAATGLHRYGNPVDQAGQWYEEFKTNSHENYRPDVAHLSSGFGGSRYGLWRIAMKLFTENPVHGIGVDNFAVDNIRLRRGLNDSDYPHSLEMRVLSQTGIVGTVLFVTFLVGALIGVAASLRRGSNVSRGLAAAALAAFVYWFAHGSVDWFWEIPALAAPALAVLGISMRLGEPEAPDSGRRRRPMLVAAGAVVVVAACVSLVPPLLAARDIDHALQGWRADPEAALDRLDRARKLDPLTDRADIYASLIAAEIGSGARQRTSLLRAVDRNPHNWYPYMELGVLEMRANRKAAALRQLAIARRLNPLEPALTVVEDWLKEGRRPTRKELDDLLLSRAYHLQGGAT